MENNNISIINQIIEANPFLYYFSQIWFWSGVIILALYIRKHNNLTILDTLKAIVGMKSINRNWIINLGHLLVLGVPLLICVKMISKN